MSSPLAKTAAFFKEDFQRFKARYASDWHNDRWGWRKYRWGCVTAFGCAAILGLIDRTPFYLLPRPLDWTDSKYWILHDTIQYAFIFLVGFSIGCLLKKGHVLSSLIAVLPYWIIITALPIYAFTVIDSLHGTGSDNFYPIASLLRSLPLPAIAVISSLLGRLVAAKFARSPSQRALPENVS